MNEALKDTEKYEEMKRSNVPLGMTFDHHAWNITQADEKEAVRRFQEAKANFPEEEFERQVRDDEISVAIFDESRQYKHAMANYVGKDGKVGNVERTALENESDHIVRRVLADMNIVFATASNCGGELLGGANSFEPTVIVCDAAGQISIASLCVPLTTFTKWEGLFLFGDVQQLKPSAFSGQYNEFVHDAKVSPLALLAMKGVQPILLKEQYRMAPACSAFPRMEFYDDKGLKDSAEVKIDNAIRKAVREVSIGLGVVGENGEGSEYFVTNVARGCSRVEVNGTSLVNHANADVIMDLIDRLLRTIVVKAAMIKILTYYQGQRRLLRRLINSRPWPRAIKDAIEIATVDSFNGRESAVVIVDLVAAKERLRRSRPEEQEIPDDEGDVGTEDYIKVGAVTNHVRDPNRLNVALTRGRDSTIVICQAALLASTFKSRRGKLKNALSNMIGDAESRNLLVEHNRDDSHPDSVKGRADKSTTELRTEQEKQKEVDFDLIRNSTRRWHAVKFLNALPPAEPAKYYRTPTGHTTRPIGEPKLAAEADAYDEQMQLEQAKDASKDTEAAREENEMALNLGVKESLGLTGQSSTMDSGMDVDAQGNEDSQNAGGHLSEPVGSEDGDVEDDADIADEYWDMDQSGGRVHMLNGRQIEGRKFDLDVAVNTRSGYKAI